jgi:hypothetical protein
VPQATHGDPKLNNRPYLANPTIFLRKMCHPKTNKNDLMIEKYRTFLLCGDIILSKFGTKWANKGRFFIEQDVAVCQRTLG